MLYQLTISKNLTTRFDNLFLSTFPFGFEGPLVIRLFGSSLARLLSIRLILLLLFRDGLGNEFWYLLLSLNVGMRLDHWTSGRFIDNLLRAITGFVTMSLAIVSE